MTLPLTGHPAYGALFLAGIVVTALAWGRLARAGPEMVIVYAAGLLGALVGAKVVFLALEWPYYFGQPDFWMQALVGKTITGGILGGYAGVELGKRIIRHPAPTGDAFAITVPLGLFLGRLGCFINGCCLGRRCEPAWYAVVDEHGVPRFPVSLAEAGFNLLTAGVLFLLHRRGVLRFQLFHVFLIAYGTFRFFHEFLRDTPRLFPHSDWPVVRDFTTYQLAALAIVALGVWRFIARRRQVEAIAPKSGESC